MPEPLLQAVNNKIMNCFMNYAKSLSVPTFKNGTLIIGYLNAAISILFVIVSSCAMPYYSHLFYMGNSNNYQQSEWSYSNQILKFYSLVNFIGPSIILTVALVCFGFTVALIYGTHRQKTQFMRVYLSFGAVSLMLSIGFLSLIVVIMAFFGQLSSMIFAMQTFFFLGVYVVELHVIHRTIEVFETPSDVQETLMKDEKDTSLPPYERCEYVPRLTTVA